MIREALEWKHFDLMYVNKKLHNLDKEMMKSPGPRTAAVCSFEKLSSSGIEGQRYVYLEIRIKIVHLVN